MTGDIQLSSHMRSRRNRLFDIKPPDRRASGRVPGDSPYWHPQICDWANSIPQRELGGQLRHHQMEGTGPGPYQQRYLPSCRMSGPGISGFLRKPGK